jgi:hypothetical protein
MATRTVLINRLAEAMGDATTGGTPNYLVGSGFKFAQTAYENAIDFSIELLKRKYPIMTVGSLVWGSPQLGSGQAYEFTVPNNMVKVTRAVQETSAGNNILEKMIPLNIVVASKNTSGSRVIQLDRETSNQLTLNASGANIRLHGYMYQAPPTGGGSAVDINNSIVLLLSKMYLHQSGASRDPAEMLKSMRQLEQARDMMIQFDDMPITAPGIWLDE